MTIEYGSLYKLIESGFGIDQDYNCSEKILYGANLAYNLGLHKGALILASGFGSGMGIESTCGALTAGIMVLSKLFVEDYAHEDERIKILCKEFLDRYRQEMGSINCNELKEKYRTEEQKCYYVILKSAEILDHIIQREIEKA